MDTKKIMDNLIEQTEKEIPKEFYSYNKGVLILGDFFKVTIDDKQVLQLERLGYPERGQIPFSEEEFHVVIEELKKAINRHNNKIKKIDKHLKDNLDDNQYYKDGNNKWIINDFWVIFVRAGAIFWRTIKEKDIYARNIITFKLFKELFKKFKEMNEE